MKRRLLPVVAALAIAVLLAVLFLLMRPSEPSAPAPANAAQADPVQSLHDEMACVDRVVANRNLKAEEVQPALDRCRSGGAAVANSTQ